MAASTKLGIMLSGNNRNIADDFGGVDSPKLKFNFGIEFTYSDMMEGEEEGDWDRNKNIFAIKQISRPAPNILYEDVNYYNYMTKVATKVDFAIITVTLYDDKNNLAHKIFSRYLKSISPTTRINHNAQEHLVDKQGRGEASNLGPHTEDGKNSPIHAIRVFHYTDGDRMVIYHYLNPKIQNVALDELDMTQSDVNTITFNFMYDSVHVEYFPDADATTDFPDCGIRAPKEEEQAFCGGMAIANLLNAGKPIKTGATQQRLDPNDFSTGAKLKAVSTWLSQLFTDNPDG